MEVRVLRYFLAVAREQTISGAAEVLHISQPTLSRQLMDMEAELGKHLFIQGFMGQASAMLTSAPCGTRYAEMVQKETGAIKYCCNI